MVHSSIRLFLVMALLLAPEGGFDGTGMRAQATTAAGTPLTFGDTALTLPTGWKHVERPLGGSNALVLIPPDLGTNGRFMVVVLPGRDLGEADLQQAFEKAIRGSLAAGERLLQDGATQVHQSEAGYRVLMHSIQVADASERASLRVFCATRWNGRLEMLIAMAESPETLKRYQSDFDQILNGIHFSSTEGGAGAVKESAPAQSAGSSLNGESASPGRPVAIRRGLWVDAGPLVQTPDGKKIGVIVNDIAYDSTNHTIYISTFEMLHPDAGGIFASADGGQSWTKLLRPNTKQVVPTASSRMYALEFGERISYSNDRGKTWARCRRPMFQSRGFTDAAAIQCIAVSPASPNIVYAGANGMGGGLYRSTDGGQTWTRPARRYVVGTRGDTVEGREMEVNEIAVDPDDPNAIILGLSTGYVQSNDGGVTAYDCLHSGAGAGAARRGSSPVKVVHPGSIQINATSPNVIYLRNNRMKATELYRTDDGGRRWNALPRVPDRFIQTLVAHPLDPQILYATTESGIYVTENAGASWVRLESGNAPQSTGGFTIPYYFSGTPFNSVATIVHQDEPLIVDPTTGHLLYGTSGVRVLVGVR